MEVKSTIQLCKEKLVNWIENNEDGKKSDSKAQEEKMNNLCCLKDGKIGITCTMDGAWQKRGTGTIYNSRTGHNFALGALSQRILSLVVYSKHCQTCKNAKKINSPAKKHRCSKNFPTSKSAKSMEGIGAVQHCVNIFNNELTKCQAYINCVVTDNGSTTRANLHHSIKAKLDEQFGLGNWNKTETWPKINGKDLPDKGLLPLYVPEVCNFKCYISHWCKVIGTAMYQIRKGYDPQPKDQIITKYSKDSKKNKKVFYINLIACRNTIVKE